MKKENIEIYSSKKKAILILLGSIIFVIGGIFMFWNAENSSSYRSPIFLKVVGILSILFFGAGIFISIQVIIKDKLMLVVDEFGINVNPKKADCINWGNINGFSEIKIHSTKFVIIDINNPEYWIESEPNIIRQKLMNFNLRNYGSPFNLSANSMQINHNKLLEILNENFIKYKYNAQQPVSELR